MFQNSSLKIIYMISYEYISIVIHGIIFHHVIDHVPNLDVHIPLIQMSNITPDIRSSITPT